MKEKYKAIIEKIEENKSGVRVWEQLTRYTYANNVSEAQRNIIYHLQNDDKIYLGIDKNSSSGESVFRWEISRIDLERNFEEVKKGRGKDKQKRHRRTREEIEKDTRKVTIEINIKQSNVDAMYMYTGIINISIDDYINDLLSKDLVEKKQAIREFENVMKKLRGGI